MTDFSTLRSENASRLDQAFASHEARLEQSACLDAALAAMCTETHFRKLAPAQVVVAMRETCERFVRPAAVTIDEWLHSFHAAPFDAAITSAASFSAIDFSTPLG